MPKKGWFGLRSSSRQSLGSTLSSRESETPKLGVAANVSCLAVQSTNHQPCPRAVFNFMSPKSTHSFTCHHESTGREMVHCTSWRGEENRCANCGQIRVNQQLTFYVKVLIFPRLLQLRRGEWLLSSPFLWPKRRTKTSSSGWHGYTQREPTEAVDGCLPPAHKDQLSTITTLPKECSFPTGSS